jgi:hypothetical protein
MALPCHANFLIPGIVLLAGIMHPTIALGFITQVWMMAEDWPGEAILILCFECDRMTNL